MMGCYRDFFCFVQGSPPRRVHADGGQGWAQRAGQGGNCDYHLLERASPAREPQGDLFNRVPTAVEDKTRCSSLCATLGNEVERCSKMCYDKVPCSWSTALSGVFFRVKYCHRALGTTPILRASSYALGVEIPCDSVPIDFGCAGAVALCTTYD